jgi:DNA-binding phage protein
MSSMALRVYQSAKGKSPFADWFHALDPTARAKISAARWHSGPTTRLQLMISKQAMPLTLEFKEVFKASIEQDPAFGHELLCGAVQCLLDNDLATGRAILRNYVNATIGFQQLAKVIGGQEKSLMRMLSPSGSPVAANLFRVIHALQEFNGVVLEVNAVAKNNRKQAGVI